MTAAAADPPPAASVVGCSYFGVRIVRHVARDMEDLARRGFTGVLHTFSENDLAYYRGTMRRIFEVSHDLGLEVQTNPWGLGRTFGGGGGGRRGGAAPPRGGGGRRPPPPPPARGGAGCRPRPAPPPRPASTTPS